MKRKKVLVTGAGGYIGGHVVKTLLDLGSTVIAVDLQTRAIDKRAIIKECDIFSGKEDIFQELGCPDVCLHMAWKDGFNHNSDSHLLFLPDHYIFLSNLIKNGIKQVAVMGSMHEIGYFEGEVNEDTPTSPYSMYGISKNALHEAISVLHSRNDFIFQWLRAFYIYGDDLKNNSIFSKLIRAEQLGEKSFPFTSGKNKYDFISIDDLSMQIALSVLQTKVTGVINCCSGKPVSLKDYVEDFLAKNHFKIELEYNAYPDRPYDSPAIWGNPDKILSIIRDSSIKSAVFSQISNNRETFGLSNIKQNKSVFENILR